MVERAAVIFFNTDGIPVERFVFKLAVNLSYGSKVEEADLEFSLRSFLIKLSVSESLTKVLPRSKCWIWQFGILILSLILHSVYMCYKICLFYFILFCYGFPLFIKCLGVGSYAWRNSQVFAAFMIYILDFFSFYV